MVSRSRTAFPASGPSALAANEAAAQAWLRDFEDSAAFAVLARSVQESLPGAVRVMAYCFTRRWSRASETTYGLDEMTDEDAIDVLTVQLPWRVAAVDPDMLIDGLAEFLVWATKTGRVREKRVEYACRNKRREAAAAMKDERKWAPGKEIIMRALHDGIALEHLSRVREHAIGRGLDPSFVDEFLPPGPAYLGGGRWLWLDP